MAPNVGALCRGASWPTDPGARRGPPGRHGGGRQLAYGSRSRVRRRFSGAARCWTRSPYVLYEVPVGCL